MFSIECVLQYNSLVHLSPGIQCTVFACPWRTCNSTDFPQSLLDSRFVTPHSKNSTFRSRVSKLFSPSTSSRARARSLSLSLCVFVSVCVCPRPQGLPLTHGDARKGCSVTVLVGLTMVGRIYRSGAPRERQDRGLAGAQ